MEKSCHSSGGDSTVTSTTSSGGGGGGGTSSSNSSNSRDGYLKHLNKISHKISKPVRRVPTYDQNQIQNPLPPPPPPPSVQQQATAAQSQPAPPQQHQPPVYNINKNDFRDVVQRLTGSPAHERFSTPPPIQPPKPPSSRLQRIRPPPLAQISNRPPPMAPIGNPQSQPNMVNPVGGGPTNAGFMGGQRQPLSPLPPFPAVHAAAESPISAYMRFLQGSISSSVPSPRWNNFQHPPPPAQLPQQQNIPPPPQPSMPLPPFPNLPASPLPFGCMPSPRSPYALLSPRLLLSPNGQLGFPQVPLSPTLPVPSPRWNGI